MARDENGRWMPGESPNPGGRPAKGMGLTDALREHADKDTLANKLIEIALAGNVAALKYIYDRIEGQPKQHLNVEDDRQDAWQLLVRDVFVGPESETEGDSQPLQGGEAEGTDT